MITISSTTNGGWAYLRVDDGGRCRPQLLHGRIPAVPFAAAQGTVPWSRYGTSRADGSPAPTEERATSSLTSRPGTSVVLRLARVSWRRRGYFPRRKPRPRPSIESSSSRNGSIRIGREHAGDEVTELLHDPRQLGRHRHHDDGDRPERRLAVDHLRHLVPVDLGQMEVEQDE